MLHIKKLFYFLTALEKFATTWNTKSDEKETRNAEVVDIPNLMERLGGHAGAINLLEIHAYLRSSKVQSPSPDLLISVPMKDEVSKKNHQIQRESNV